MFIKNFPATIFIIFNFLNFYLAPQSFIIFLIVVFITILFTLKVLYSVCLINYNFRLVIIFIPIVKNNLIYFIRPFIYSNYQVNFLVTHILIINFHN